MSKPLCRCPHGTCYLHPSVQTCGMREDVTTNTEAAEMIEQLCRDLNDAHNEILRLQGCHPEQYPSFDWPEWSGPANSIRWAEKVLGKPLSKTSLRKADPGKDAPTHG